MMVDTPTPLTRKFSASLGKVDKTTWAHSMGLSNTVLIERLKKVEFPNIGIAPIIGIHEIFAPIAQRDIATQRVV